MHFSVNRFFLKSSYDRSGCWKLMDSNLSPEDGESAVIKVEET